MSHSTEQPNSNVLSEPAQELLEQYKNYRDDGIIEIKEPVTSQHNDSNQEQEEEEKDDKKDNKHRATEIAEKLIKNKKQKRRAIINKLKQNKTNNNNNNNNKEISSPSIMGVDESWWNEMTKQEDKFVNDYKYKLNNINLMQQYETKKDPSPFNKDNDMDLQKNWDNYLWNESIEKQQEYLHKKHPSPKPMESTKSKPKQTKKKKVKFASNLVTKQGISESVNPQITKLKSPQITPIKPHGKKLKFPSKQQYGDLVGFFNKSTNTKKKKKKKENVQNATTKTMKNINNINNPYLDNDLIKGFKDYSPDKNQSFEQKFNHKNITKQEEEPVIIGSDEFSSMILPSNNQETKPQNKPKSILKKTNRKKELPAFNGQVFERKPPDMVYMNDDDKNIKKNNKKQSIFKSQIKSQIKPQKAPKITESKNSSLFKKRIVLNDELYEENENNDDDDEDKEDEKYDKRRQENRIKKVRFAPNLVTKQSIIKAGDKCREKEDICLIFLDVDGVLNCSYSPSLSKQHILRLKKIISTIPNCKICISSSWRIYPQNRLRLINGLEQYGGIDVNHVIIGDTPKLPKDALKCRAEEIKIYLECDEYLNDNYNVLRWCAIDDIPLDIINSDYTEFIKHHFVKTNPSKGLTDHDVEKIICILNGGDQEIINKKLAIISQKRKEMEKNMKVQVIKKKKNKSKKQKKEKLKLLFLDVDGVLNYRDFDDNGVNGALSVEHLYRLKEIIDKTDCKIILSTSWRRIPTAKEQLLRQLSCKVGIDINKYVLGDTPNLGSQMKKSMEICQYLQNNNKYHIISWVAIDDMPLNKIGTKQTKEMLKNHFVKTDIKIGLSDKNVIDAIAILNVTNNQ